MAKAVEQYPHYLFAVEGGEAVKDESGSWSDDETPKALKFLSRCREEADGRGTEISVGGGKFHKVTSLVQLPKGAPIVALGAPVIVANDHEGNDIRIQGVCLKFDPAQLHSRLWV